MTNDTTLPFHDSLTVFDRRIHVLPTEECAIEIFVDGGWLMGVWYPRTPASKADAGYLGTVRTSTPFRIGSYERVVQLGFHAWEQNASEFLFYCLPTKP
jgi:hypothetical protein